MTTDAPPPPDETSGGEGASDPLRSRPGPGRPPLFVRDRTLTERLCKLLRAGAFREDAARTLGIAPETISRWMSRKGKKYRAFRQAVEEAEAQAATDYAEQISKAAKKDWKAAAWWLERRRHQQFGRREAVEVSGPGGGAVQLETKVDVRTLPLDELERLVRGEPAPGGGGA